jgi:hypothetical protein
MKRCCGNKSIKEIEYDIGSLGIQTYRVCQKHLEEEPWNKHIISQKRIGD